MGRTLLYWSLCSLKSFIKSGSAFLFVGLSENKSAPHVDEVCRELEIENYLYCDLDTATGGQAETVLLAKEVLDHLNIPIAIYNIDTHVNPKYLSSQTIFEKPTIPCFPGEGTKWSFVQCDLSGKIVSVKEKQRVSDNASIGLYSFDSFLQYEAAYKDQYAGNADTSHERYIAPIYNSLINRDIDVSMLPLPLCAVFPMGTPEDVDCLLESGTFASYIAENTDFC